jgi:protein-disulfide isomerase
MASGNKKRGPKPRPSTSAKSSSGKGSSGTTRSAKGRSVAKPLGATRRGLSPQWWIVIGAVVIAAVVGIVVQSNRSKTENTKVVTPKHQLGPNGSEIEGAASAPVLVQEYADFQCPSCKLFHDRVQPTVDRLVEQGKIRYAYSYFPFIGEESVRAAAAAACAGDQDKFFPYSDLLYTNQQGENSGFLTTDRLVAFGRDAGITGSAFDTFEQCVRSNRYEGYVRQQAENASKRGIHQTPTVFVNGRELTNEQVFVASAFEQAVADAAAAKT